MSAPTDLTVKASASGQKVTENNEPRPSESAAETDVLVFICYRRDDGQSHADWIERALNGWECTRANGSKRRVRTYFDRTAPAVADWTKYHLPSLQSAQCLIVVCTPGAAKDLSTPGKPDWVYEEVQWWVANRSHPPIVVDVTADGERWIPEPILQKWPNINRVPLRLNEAQSATGIVDERYLERWRRQIENTLHESERATTFDTVAKLRSLNTKLQRRQKFLTGALVVAAVLAAMSFWSFQVASSANASSKALNRFLGGLFRQADPDQTLRAPLTADEMLKTGVKEVRRSRDPGVQIQMLTAIGAAYTGLGKHDTAIGLLDEAAKLAEQHWISTQSQFNLELAHGEALLYKDRFNEARGPLERALELSQDRTDRSYALATLGDLESWAPDGDRALAEKLYQQAVAIDRELKALLSEARNRNRLGYLAREERKPADARDHYAAASTLVRQAGEPDGSLLVATYDHDLATTQYELGELPGARASFELARHQLEKVYGKQSTHVAIVDNNIARIAIEQGGDLAGVEQRLDRAIATLESNHGPNYRDLSKLLNNLGLVLRERGDRVAARDRFKQGRTIAETHKDLSIAAQALIHLAETSMADGDFAQADSDLRQAYTHFPTPETRTGWRFALYEGALAELRIANCDKGVGDDLKRSDAVLLKHWPSMNMFRRANEERWAQLKTLQTDGTPRCRGAGTDGQAKKS